MTTRKPVFILFQFELMQVLRSRWLWGYGMILFLFSFGLMYYSGGEGGGASLLNLLLLIVPLVSILFATFQMQESLPFAPNLLMKDISRSEILWCKYLSLFLALAVVHFVVFLSNILIRAGELREALIISILSVGLQAAFMSLGFFLASLIQRKELLLGAGILVWFYSFILYDLIVFGLSTLTNDLPISPVVFGMVALNPIDLARITYLIQLGNQSIMTFSTALLVKMMGGMSGVLTATIVLAIWMVLPLYFATRIFAKRDL